MDPTSTLIAGLYATETATATATSGSEKGPQHGGGNHGECELLGPFALFIQGALGGLALLSLVYKRWRERPQRPVKIWAFDASKQVFGSVLLHIANLLMSMLSAGQLTVSPSTTREYQPNPCSFYLLNLAIDTTIGIPILIVLLRLFHYGFSLTPVGNPPESIQSGNYGQPPKTSWWFKQSMIYFLGLLGMKICVFFIFHIMPWIVMVGDWALKWTEGNEMVQVFFVMLLFPVIMNAVQYYIIDSFIKNQKPTDHEPIPSEDGEGEEDEGDAHIRRRLSRALEHSVDDALLETEDEAGTTKTTGKVKAAAVGNKSAKSNDVSKLSADSRKLGEYNPDTDGEESPTVVGSGSTSAGGDDRPLLSKEEGRKKLALTGQEGQ
ncbi:MAG: hypothetical protein M1830_005952 [Pleopsidium flavum]|nr:MAG: hypothetical protein M1830_005952 [Pleopsidium flavum]